MSSRTTSVLFVAPLIIAAPLLFTALACDALIGLGPTATRASVDGGDAATNGGADGGEGGATGDGAAADGANACGVGRHPNPVCEACVLQKCCDQGVACAPVPSCVEGTKCLSDCHYQVDCLSQCTSTYGVKSPEFVAARDCWFASCGVECYPAGTCYDLLQCCYRVTDAAVKESCFAAVETADVGVCSERFAHVFAAYCPSDGGGGG